MENAMQFFDELREKYKKDLEQAMCVRRFASTSCLADGGVLIRHGVLALMQ
jgi:hypothetical protein